MGLLDKLIQKNSAPNTQKVPDKPMLGLSISAGIVKATIWELKDHTIEIIGLGVKNFSDAGNEMSPDYKTIAEKAADAIDIACQVAEVDVRESVFGVPQSWIADEQLLPEYDELTTSLAKNLDLEAIAYVSIPHALSYYLQYLHKTPPTAILIGTSREGAQIAFVENGKIKENTYIQWVGNNLGKNIDHGLMQLKTLTTLPPTMFLYGFGDMTTAQEELMRYSWTSSERLGADKKAPTMITNPKIIILEEHADALAIALVGAKDFARHNNIHGRLSIKSLEYPAMNSQTPVVTQQEPQMTSNEQKSDDAPLHPKTPEHDTIPETLQKTKMLEKTHELEPNRHDTEDVPFGFVVDKDIMHKEKIVAPTHHDEIHTDPVELEQPASIRDTETDELENPQEETSNNNDPWDENEKDTLMQTNKSPRKKLSIPKKGVKQLLYIGIIIVVILIGVGSTAAWAYWNIPTAKVTVYVKPDNLEKQVTITASEKTTEVGNNMIPARKIEIELQESRTASTSGKRATGQVAKGEVNVMNKTGAAKTFNAGTELRTSDNQKFTLAESVTVASASAQTTDTGETKTYGIEKVKVNAVDIGPQGNIPKDTSLSISGITKDDYEAKVVADFTGGSKRDIKVVSATDRTSLLKDLRADMEFKIPQTVREKVADGEILLDKAWAVADTTDTFNKSVNDESDTITLNSTMNIVAYTVKKSDVEKLLEGIATTAVPEGFELKDQAKDIRTEFISLSKDGVVTINAISKVNIIPILDTKQIAQQIIGKQEEAARQTILDNKKVFDVSFEYSVNLPPPFATLPHKVENIEVTRGVR